MVPDYSSQLAEHIDRLNLCCQGGFLVAPLEIFVGLFCLPLLSTIPLRMCCLYVTKDLCYEEKAWYEQTDDQDQSIS